MKVICAGLPKTGTKTMAEALRILGYNVHDVFHQFMVDGDLWKKVRNNTVTKKDFQDTFENVDAVTDFPACFMWEQILEAFPDAKVVLMDRSSENEWYESVRYHREYTLKFMPMYRWGNLVIAIADLLLGPLRREFMAHNEQFIRVGCHPSVGTASEMLTRNLYRQHNSYVKTTCPKDQLLVFNVREGWEPLCTFLEVPVPEQPFPLKNKKASIVDSIVSGEYEHDCGYYRKVVKEISVRLALYLAVIVGLISCVVTYWLR